MGRVLSIVETVPEAGLPFVQWAWDALQARRLSGHEVLLKLNEGLAGVSIAPIGRTAFYQYAQAVIAGKKPRPVAAPAMPSGPVKDARPATAPKLRVASAPMKDARLTTASKLRVASFVRGNPLAAEALPYVLTEAEIEAVGRDLLADIVDLLCGDDDEQRMLLAFVIAALYGPELGDGRSN